MDPLLHLPHLPHPHRLQHVLPVGELGAAPLVPGPSVPPPLPLTAGVSPVTLLILPPGEPVNLTGEAALGRDVLLLLLLLLLLVVPGGGEAGEARGVDSGDTVAVPHTVVSLGTVAAEGLSTPGVAGSAVTAETAGGV